MWRTCFQSEPDCSILHHLCMCMFNPQHTVCNMVDRYNTGSLSYTDWASQCQLEQCHQSSYHYIQQMPGRSWRSPWGKPQALQWRYSSLCQLFCGACQPNTVYRIWWRRVPPVPFHFSPDSSPKPCSSPCPTEVVLQPGSLIIKRSTSSSSTGPKTWQERA